MKKTTVLIVDDSVTYRNLLNSILSADPQIEVVSQAPNGKLALPRIRHYKPEFIILDQEMPEMTGLETLHHIQQESPESKVIMFSSHTVEGAKVTLKALELGAIDFVTKPEVSTDIEAYINRELVQIIKEISSNKKEILTTTVVPKTKITQTETSIKKANTNDFLFCAIGISTGGPVALRQLLQTLPANLDGSIFIVQHMPPVFTEQLAESLNNISPLIVHEARPANTIEKGHVYIAPGGKHMQISSHGSRININDDPPIHNCRPSVDLLFSSMANKTLAPKTLGIIMTGMGNDGLIGMQNLKREGAYLLAQNESSCVVYSMPMHPTKSGLIHETHNIQGISRRIIELMGVLN